jgi:hypothetical protein
LVRRTYLATVVVIAVLFVLLVLPAEGFNGITSGNRNNNCNNSGCHSSDGSISVGFSSPTTQVAPGQQVTVTVITTGTGSNSGRVGIIISTPTGAQPSTVGWAVVRDPSQSTSFNNYVDMSGPSSGTYSWTLTAPTLPGTYSLAARVAFVKSGTKAYNDASSQLSFIVGSTAATPPSVSVSSPANGALVKGDLTVNAAVTPGTNAVNYVQFRIDGALVGNRSAAPYSFTLNTTAYPDVQHTLTVTAVDSTGLSGTGQAVVTFNNTGSAKVAPIVAVSSPVSGSSVSGAINVNATVTGVSTVTWVRLSVDGQEIVNRSSSPYDFDLDTTKLSNGQHTINVTASGPDGALGWKELTIDVQNQGAPESGNEDVEDQMVLNITAGSLAVIAVFAGLLVLISSVLRRRRGK